MRVCRPSVRSCLKSALGAARARLNWRLLVAIFLVVPLACSESVASGDELPAPMLAPLPIPTSNTDFARSEVRASFPVIAPEPTELPPGTRSIYDEALLGEEAPTLLLTVAGESAATQESAGVIAPTSDADAVTAFESSATCCDLPPIRYIDDAWSF